MFTFFKGQNIHPMVTRAKAGIFKPKIHIASGPLYPPKPHTIKQALANPIWFKAMQTKYNALLQNKTWILTDLPPSVIVVGCKWIYKNKLDANGTLQFHKARLVAKDFHQVAGLVYNETFGLIIKPVVVRVVLAHALSSNRHIHQVNIINAFLYGDLEETVNMQQPPSFVSTNLI